MLTCCMNDSFLMVPRTNFPYFVTTLGPTVNDGDGSMGVIKTVGVHVDNCRDMANKVGTVTFKAGPCLEKLTVVKLADVESRSGHFSTFWYFLGKKYSSPWI